MTRSGEALYHMPESGDQMGCLCEALAIMNREPYGALMLAIPAAGPIERISIVLA